MTRPNAWQPIESADVDRLAELHAAADTSPFHVVVTPYHRAMHDALPELLRVYRAWLDAPEGEYRHDYIDNRLAVGIVRKEGDGAALFSEIPDGQSVRLMASGAAPVEGSTDE